MIESFCNPQRINRSTQWSLTVGIIKRERIRYYVPPNESNNIINKITKFLDLSTNI